jgi:hypothetical protein
VTDFIQDRLVTMKDLKNGMGSCTLQTTPITDLRSLYTYQIDMKMYPPYEQDFFEIFKDELNRIKIEAERRYRLIE